MKTLSVFSFLSLTAILTVAESISASTTIPASLSQKRDELLLLKEEPDFFRNIASFTSQATTSNILVDTYLPSTTNTPSARGLIARQENPVNSTLTSTSSLDTTEVSSQIESSAVSTTEDSFSTNTVNPETSTSSDASSTDPSAPSTTTSSDASTDDGNNQSSTSSDAESTTSIAPTTSEQPATSTPESSADAAESTSSDNTSESDQSTINQDSDTSATATSNDPTTVIVNVTSTSFATPTEETSEDSSRETSSQSSASSTTLSTTSSASTEASSATGSLATQSNKDNSGGGGLSTKNRNIVIGVVVGVGGFLLILGVAFVVFRLKKKSIIGGREKHTSIDENSDAFRANIDQYHAPRPNTAANF